MATRKTTAKTAAVSKADRKAPGNAKAREQRAADNAKKLNDQRGKAETIAVVKNTADGEHIYVEGSKGSSFTRSKRGDNKEFRTFAAKGALYEPAARYNRENPAPKPTARLARGIGSGDAPHSAKAVADQPKADAKGKSAKPAAPKAAKNKQPARGADRDYAKGKTAITAKPDSWRHHMLTVIQKHTNTAKAKAAHEKSGKFSGNKLDFNWAAAQGYIAWAK